MEWFGKLFGRSGKAKRDYPNLIRGRDPLELWNKTGEIGDGAFGKVYKVENEHCLYVVTGAAGIKVWPCEMACEKCSGCGGLGGERERMRGISWTCRDLATSGTL